MFVIRAIFTFGSWIGGTAFKRKVLKDEVKMDLQALPITTEMSDAGKLLTPDFRAEHTLCCAFILPSNTTTVPQPGVVQ